MAQLLFQLTEITIGTATTSWGSTGGTPATSVTGSCLGVATKGNVSERTDAAAWKIRLAHYAPFM